MNYKELSKKTYFKFSNKDGTDHIAGDYALEEILRIINRFRIADILEIGLGIGSISDAVFNFAEENRLAISYSGTEANEHCLLQLPLNVQKFDQINLYKGIIDIPQDVLFDLVIIDGSDTMLSEIKKHCSQNALLFIEGGRAVQIDILKELFPKMLMVEIISISKPPNYLPFHQKWTEGGSLIAVNPTLDQRIFVLAEKVKTYSKRRIGKYLK